MERVKMTEKYHHDCHPYKISTGTSQLGRYIRYDVTDKNDDFPSFCTHETHTVTHPARLSLFSSVSENAFN